MHAAIFHEKHEISLWECKGGVKSMLFSSLFFLILQCRVVDGDLQHVDATATVNPQAYAADV